MGRESALGRLADLAEAQEGLVTTRQAEAHAVPRRDLSRLVQAGGYEHIGHGVYRVAGVPRPRLLELRVAWLQLAPGTSVDQRTASDGVVSHTSAALVHDVGLLDPRTHEFTVPGPRRLRSRRDDVVIHSAPLPDNDATWHDGLLVTTPRRTVADLASARTDGDHLAGVVSDILSARLARRDHLAAALAPHAQAYLGRPASGQQFLRHLLTLGQPYLRRRICLRHES